MPRVLSWTLVGLLLGWWAVWDLVRGHGLRGFIQVLAIVLWVGLVARLRPRRRDLLHRVVMAVLALGMIARAFLAGARFGWVGAGFAVLLLVAVVLDVRSRSLQPTGSA